MRHRSERDGKFTACSANALLSAYARRPMRTPTVARPNSFSEVKAYRGQGVGGLGGFLLLFVLVSPFLLPAYVGRMYQEDGKENPVSGWTGLWNLLPYVGVFVYIAKVQGALNRFWESKGATTD